jgi:hypothetical protein
MFRSLHDPDRGHCGVGLHWAWFDEAAFIDAIAWDYLRPALTDFGGAAFFTSSVDGFDWTYDRVEKPALIDKKPGFWAASGGRSTTRTSRPSAPTKSKKRAVDAAAAVPAGVRRRAGELHRVGVRRVDRRSVAGGR